LHNFPISCRIHKQKPCRAIQDGHWLRLTFPVYGAAAAIACTGIPFSFINDSRQCHGFRESIGAAFLTTGAAGGIGRGTVL
jgi:hypothetical protein